MRINKYLALCGLSSRRKVEEYITEHRVKINGTPINRLSIQVDPEKDTVEVDNKIVTPCQKYYYIILNKPKGYITTVDDIFNRPIIMQLIPEKYKRAGVFPVGRLDKDTEGLLLLTNDGDVAYRMTHPKFEIPKEYIVYLDRPLAEKDKLRLEKGIRLYGQKTGPSKIQPAGTVPGIIKITIREGKKRQVRLMFKETGYHVKYLKRISFGPIKLPAIQKGDFRLLKEGQIKALKKYLQEKNDEK